MMFTSVSMIALGGPKLKPGDYNSGNPLKAVSMIALGGPKLKLSELLLHCEIERFQ